ncbi:MAG: glycerophosphodiester phosphodiesterase [Bryobacteraceae bacterium]
MPIRTLALALLTVLSMPAAPRILVHGHRGARAMRPENTIPAFEYAIEAGVDVLELDMAVTKDNVLVVSHDPRLTSQICRGPVGSNVIRELTLEQLKQWDCGTLKNPGFPKQQPVPGTTVPTLDEVFDLGAKGTFEFNIETKIFADKPELTPPPAEFAQLVVDAIRRHKLEKRVMVQSFDFRTLQEVKKIAPEIRLSALYAVGFKNFVSIGKEAGATIVSPHYMLVTKGRVDAAHAAGLQVVPWTANTPKDWDKLVDAGVDAIISDDPAELIRYLKEKNLR